MSFFKSSYFKPKSVTWWSGVILVLLGVAQIICRECGYAQAGEIVAAFMGSHDASPVSLIAMGTGLIGIRAKQQRTYDAQ